MTQPTQGPLDPQRTGQLPQQQSPQPYITPQPGYGPFTHPDQIYHYQQLAEQPVANWGQIGVNSGVPIKKSVVPLWAWLSIMAVVLALGIIVTLAITGSPPFQQKTKGQQVVDLFNSAGLEAKNPTPMKKEDFGPTPQVAIEAIHFYAPSIDNTGTAGGRVMVFSSQRDLEIVRDYYIGLGDSSRLFFSWVFIKDNVLVQINGDLPQLKALQYDAALNKL